MVGHRGRLADPRGDAGAFVKITLQLLANADRHPACQSSPLGKAVRLSICTAVGLGEEMTIAKLCYPNVPL